MDFYKYAEKGNMIVDEVAEQLGFPGNRDLAGRLLRAVLSTLRERLTNQESFQLMAQLPMTLKGLYVDGWKYTEKPKKMKTVGDFIREAIQNDANVGHHDITTVKDGENVIRAVLKVIRRHVSEGEIKDIMQSIPPDLRPLWGEPQLENM